MTEITPEEVEALRLSLACEPRVVESSTVLVLIAGYQRLMADALTLSDKLARAVVVEGETAPIVLERPDVADALEFEGEPFHRDDASDGWQVCAADSSGRTTLLRYADSVVFRGCGHISTAEARRFAAALVAKADAVEAAQAEQERAQ